MSDFYHSPMDFSGFGRSLAEVNVPPLHHICLATISYENPDASYTFSIQRTREYLHRQGIATDYMLLVANCHVDDAKNQLVGDFLDTDCTHMMFIDSDVSWTPEQVERLLKHERDIVGGVYPYRNFEVQTEGPVRMLPDVEVRGNDPMLEVEGLPSGFMLVSRYVLETMHDDAEKFQTSLNGASPPMALLFGRTVEGKTRYGGDISFCRDWRRRGGRVWADMDMTLGHTAKKVIRGSMGSMLRRRAQSTLRYVAGKVELGTPSMGLLQEAHDYCNNHFGAPVELLAVIIDKARKAQGPILELGSGLTTIMMAAANPNVMVWCLEHDEFYAAQTQKWAKEAGVGNIMVVHDPLRDDGFYDLTDLPRVNFDLAVVDGPPRHLGSRLPFFEELGHSCREIVMDDVDDQEFFDVASDWADHQNRAWNLLPPRTITVFSIQETSDANIQTG